MNIKFILLNIISIVIIVDGYQILDGEAGGNLELNPFRYISDAFFQNDDGAPRSGLFFNGKIRSDNQNNYNRKNGDSNNDYYNNRYRSNYHHNNPYRMKDYYSNNPYRPNGFYGNPFRPNDIYSNPYRIDEFYNNRFSPNEDNYRK